MGSSFENNQKNVENVSKNGDSHVSHALHEVHGERGHQGAVGGGKFDHAHLLNTTDHEKHIAAKVSECVKDGKIVPGMEKNAEELHASITKQIEQVQAHIQAKTAQLQIAQGNERFV